MGYILKKEVASNIREKYKNSYIRKHLELSDSYVSLILNRHLAIPKRLASDFTKVINANANINDLFNEVK